MALALGYLVRLLTNPTLVNGILVLPGQHYNFSVLIIIFAEVH
jgi:hypothetical protein